MPACAGFIDLLCLGCAGGVVVVPNVAKRMTSDGYFRTFGTVYSMDDPPIPQADAQFG